MNQSIEARMQYVEYELREIRKELEESLGMYKDKGFLVKPKKPTEPAIRRIVNEKVINKDELE